MARTPKPTNLKLVTGNPGKRPLNKQEPDPEYLADLTAPEYLSPGAKSIWDQVAPKLRESRLLTVVDVPILGMLCESLFEYRRSTVHCSKSPLSKSKKAASEVESEEPDGEVKSKKTSGEVLSQWKIVQSMSLKQVMMIAREFGMTPAARTKIQVQPQGELDFGDGENYFT